MKHLATSRRAVCRPALRLPARVALLLLLAGLAPALAGPRPLDELTRLRARYLRVLEKLARADEERHTRVIAREELEVRLRRHRRGYAGLEEQLRTDTALREEVRAAIHEAARLSLAPAVLAARRRRLGGARETLRLEPPPPEPVLLAELDEELDRLGSRLHEARRARRERLPELRRRARAATRKLWELEPELPEAPPPVEPEARLLTEWSDTWLEAAKAAENSRRGQAEVLSLFARTLEKALWMNPAYLERLEVRGDAELLHRAAWVPVLERDAAPDVVRRDLRQLVGELEQGLERILATRHELFAGRMELARHARGLSRRFESLARRRARGVWREEVAGELRELEQEVLAALVTGTIQELQRGWRAMEERWAERGRTQRAGAAGPVRHPVRDLERRVDEVAGEVTDEEAAEARQWRQDLLARTAARAEARIMEQGRDPQDALGGTGRRLTAWLAGLPPAGSDLAPPALERARVVARWRELIEELPRSALDLRARLHSTGAPKTEAWQSLLEPPSLSPGASPGFQIEPPRYGEELQGALATALTRSPVACRELALEVARKGRWVRLEGGEEALPGGLKPGSLRTVVSSRRRAFWLLTGTVRAFLRGLHDGRPGGARVTFWRTYAQLGLLLGLDARLDAAHRELARLQRVHVEALTHAFAGLLVGADRRRLETGPDDPVRLPGHRWLRFTLTFSDPLSRPPEITLGDHRMRTAIASAPVRGTRWTGTISVQELSSTSSPLSVEVEIPPRNRPHGALDRDPSTPTRIAPTLDVWEGWEAGPDRNHTLRVDATSAAPAPPRTLIAQGPFTRVFRQPLDGEPDGHPPLEAPEMAPGKGLLFLTARDAAGQVVGSSTRILRTGTDQEILSTWSHLVELEPGQYRLVLEAFTPPLVLDPVVIQEGRVNHVEAGGYGRLAHSDRDGLGRQFDGHLVVRCAGEDEVLVETWDDSVDLPPGRYDVTFDDYNPSVTHRGVEVLAGTRTLVEALGYGRLRRRATDGLGRPAPATMSVHSRRQAAPLLQTAEEWVDLPPGSYQVRFEGYTPPIVFDEVRVAAGEEARIEAEGYGRLRRLVRDGTGRETGARMEVRRAGEEAPLVVTWEEWVDLPPGWYDVAFTSFRPPLVREGVLVTAHRERVLEAGDYGRLRLRRPEGEEPAATFLAFRPGDDEPLVTTRHAEMDLPPGEWEVRRADEGEASRRRVRIETHAITELELPER